MAITYKQAKEYALSVVDATHYLDYPDAYMFFNARLKGDSRMDAGVVIRKSDGEEISMSEWAMTTKTSPYLKEHTRRKRIV